MRLDLDYTGHPFLDVGLATLTAFANKRHPRDLTEADLENAARWMAEHYVVDPLKSFLTVAFTSNAWFAQTAYDPTKGRTPEEQRKRAQERAHWAQQHLFQWRSDLQAKGTADHVMLQSERDVFIGFPVVAHPLSKRLSPGRGARAQIPLTFGDEYINFFPSGDPGLPISGMSVLAFYMLPLGCAKVGGRLLAVHSDDPAILLHFASTFLGINRQHIETAQNAGERKLPETSRRKPKTLLMQILLAALEERRQKQTHRHAAPTVTGYYFTNSGQGAELDIFPLPLEVTDFLQNVVNNPKYKFAWQHLVARAWQITKAKRGQTEAPPPRYNRLYEDLFALPQDAPAFIRRYLLRRRYHPWGKDDPTAAYDTFHEAAALSWQLTALFLRKVMLMNTERIQHIRELGDALADYIVTQNDRRLLNDFLMARQYARVRAALIKASHAEVRRGHPPLVTLDRFLAVFEQAEGLPYQDWRLGRDLVLIRLFEQLYAKGWLQEHAAEVALPEDESADSPTR